MSGKTVEVDIGDTIKITGLTGTVFIGGEARDAVSASVELPVEEVMRLLERGVRLYDAVKGRLRVLEEAVARGKGTWPNSDYVRDSRWDGWLAERSSLRFILGKCGDLRENV